MRAGVSSGDISPRLGVELGGYPYFQRANTGVHDSLHAGALYLDDGHGGRALLIVTDLFWITRPQADALRAAVSATTGVGVGNIVITCSHTHSAPWMNVVFEPFPGQPPYETRVDEGYVADVVDTCARLAGEAVASAFEAEVGFVTTSCGHEAGIGGNRRDPEQGEVDADLPVLAVRDTSGVLRAVWTKYAMHPTILQGDNTLVSADFPGAMRAVMARQHPETVFLYSMGTGGDQSPRYYRQGETFEEVERYGAILGHALIESLEALRWDADARVAMASRTLDLVVKTYPDASELGERVRHLRDREADLVAAGAPYTERQTANLWRLGAECDYHNALQQDDGRLGRRYERSAPYEVAALAVGGQAWAFLPGEIFCAFGLELKRRSPFPATHVVTLANGDLPGYCVTQEALAVGGYEPGNSILDPVSGDLLVEAAVDILSQLTEGSVR